MKYKNLFWGASLLVGGTASSQVILFISMPVIANIYGASVYGKIVIFISLISIISPFVNMSFHLALPIETNDRKAIKIFYSTIFIITLLSVFWSLILSLIGSEYFFFNKNIFIYMLFLFLFSLIALFEQWGIRNKSYKVLASMYITRSLSFSLIAVIWGNKTPTFDILLYAYLISYALTSVLYIIFLKFSTYHWGNMKEYADFPLYRSPQILLNTLSNAMPMFLISSFGHDYVGFFALAERVLRAPVALISQSIGKYYLPIYSSLHDSSAKEFRSKIISTTKQLSYIAFFPSLAFFIYGADIFTLIFGVEWEIAGRFSSILSPFIFLAFINIPLVQALVILEKQAYILKWEIFTIITKTLSMLIAVLVCNIISAVIIYSAIGVMSYSILMMHSYNLLKENEKNETS